RPSARADSPGSWRGQLGQRRRVDIHRWRLASPALESQGSLMQQHSQSIFGPRTGLARGGHEAAFGRVVGQLDGHAFRTVTARVDDGCRAIMTERRRIDHYAPFLCGLLCRFFEMAPRQLGARESRAQLMNKVLGALD